MKAIIAINSKGYIGLNNTVPWRSTEDLAHFKKMTEGKVLLCGYNTYQTLPLVVKKRTMVVCDSRDTNPETFIRDNKGLDIWCIGGRKTYEKYAPYFTELHISRILDDTDGDCKEPDLRNLNKDCRIFNYVFNTNK